MLRIIPYERRNNYDVFDAFRDFENSFFGSGFTLSNNCRTDIREEDDRYILEAEMPGFEKEDISLDLDGELLTLKAEKSGEKEEKDKGGKYICRERTYGSYQRSFDVSGIETDSISAEYRNGVLRLVMPKKSPEKPTARRLEIQ